MSGGPREVLEAWWAWVSEAQGLAQSGRALGSVKISDCEDPCRLSCSCPNSFHLLLWLRSCYLCHVPSHFLISFLQTLPAFPCRDKVVSEGSFLKDMKDQISSFSSPAGDGRGHTQPHSLGIHPSDSDPTPGHTGIMAPDAEATC